MVQRNLSAPLQWTKPDLKDRSIRWPAVPEYKGIDTLRDEQFLFLMVSCKSAITDFKAALGLSIHDKDCQALARTSEWSNNEGAPEAINGFYDNYHWGQRNFMKSTNIPVTKSNKSLTSGTLPRWSFSFFLPVFAGQKRHT